MNTLHIKTGDNVQIMSGKDKGKQGKVLEVSPKEKKVIVEGRNLVTKHVKPRRQGERSCKGRSSYLCVQGNACMPQVQQAYKSRSQG